MFWNFVAIAIGGAIGSTLRYCVSLLFNGTHPIYSISTFIVNIVGSFIIGLTFALTSQYNLSPILKLFLVIGLLGGFTTFSSFSLEIVNMLRNGNFYHAVVYSLGSVIIGVICTFICIKLGFKIIN